MPDPVAELTASQLRDALGLAGDLAACHRPGEMAQQLQQLPELLGCDTVLIGEVHISGDGGDAGAVLSAEEGPVGSFDPETQAAFMRLWHQHPVVSRHFAAPALGALKISDFLSDRQWRRTELFGDCYGGRLGIGWEIATQIRFGPRVQACAALGRTNRDFSERDRAFLDVINPHLRGAYARIEREAARDSRLDLLERGIESRGDAVVVVDPQGKVLTAGPAARAVFRAWFDDWPGSAALPGAVETWRRRHRGSPDPPRLDRESGDRRLRLRLVPGSGEDAILISERRDEPPDPARLARLLPISRREAEVLALLAQGHINASIAVELDLSPNTVGRYVERIYAKLDVHNRVAATAAVRDALER
jgi:DNA-binding CsgD family transcriptional regulator